jgi:hypothetical protein
VCDDPQMMKFEIVALSVKLVVVAVLDMELKTLP